MAVTIKRTRYVGTWLSDGEYDAAVDAARALDLSLAGYLRHCAMRQATRHASRQVAAARELVEAGTDG